MQNDRTTQVCLEVVAERARQDKLWGRQDHTPEEWAVILGEEFGEVCRAIYEWMRQRPGSVDAMLQYRQELIQTAAVAVAAVETIDRLKSGQ